jgi:hypothetical protein
MRRPSQHMVYDVCLIFRNGLGLLVYLIVLARVDVTKNAAI